MQIQDINLSKSDAHTVLKHLKAVFPLTSPSINDNIAAVQRKAGHQDVIEYIEAKLKEEEGNGLYV